MSGNNFSRTIRKFVYEACSQELPSLMPEDRSAWIFVKKETES